MSLFRRKKVLMPLTKMSLGEFDIEEPGGYRNVKTFPLEVRRGRRLHVRVKSDRPLDLAISDEKGFCRSFAEGVTEGGLGPVDFPQREKVALVIGVFRGDMAELELEVWMD